MSAPDPLRPPEGVTANELAKAARKVERLKLRRRAVVKRLDDLDAELRGASRILRDLARDAAAPPAPSPAPIAVPGPEDLP